MSSPVLSGITDASYRDCLAALAGEGWKFSRTHGGHIKGIHPDAGKPVFASSTPSCSRAGKNLEATCRQALRGAPMRGQAEPGKASELSDEKFIEILRSSKPSAPALPKLQPQSQSKNPFAKKKDEERNVDPMEEAISILKSRNPSTLVTETSGHALVAHASWVAFRSEKRRKKQAQREARKAPSIAPKQTVEQTPISQETAKPDQVQEASATDTPARSMPSLESQKETNEMNAVTPVVAEAPIPPSFVAAEPQATNGGVRELSADVLALALKIAHGGLNKLEITQDMVGKTLFHEGDVTLVSGPAIEYGAPDIASRNESAIERPAVPAVPGVAINSAAISVLDILKQRPGERILVKDIAEKVWEKLGYSNLASCRASLLNRIKHQIESGEIIREDVNRMVSLKLGKIA